MVMSVTEGKSLSDGSKNWRSGFPESLVGCGPGSASPLCLPGGRKSGIKACFAEQAGCSPSPTSELDVLRSAFRFWTPRSGLSDCNRH